jgi:hypothetical protein
MTGIQKWLSVAVWSCLLTTSVVAEDILLSGANGSQIAGNIKVTGKGLPPEVTTISVEQGRILARRAAVLDAYRNLLRLVEEVTPYLYGGNETIVFEGFVKGAHITGTRYFEDGAVEVMLELPVTFLPEVRGYLKEKPKLLPESTGVRIIDFDQQVYEVDEAEWKTIVEPDTKETTVP